MRLKGGLVEWMCVGVDARGMGVDVDGVLMSGERVRDRIYVEELQLYVDGLLFYVCELLFYVEELQLYVEEQLFYVDELGLYIDN
ncbi:unnamed protein product [Arctogadus glacialis]